MNDIVTAAEADGTLSKEMVAATVMLALPVNTLLMSLVFYLVGEQKLTMVVSYLPYPVVAGFLGSIGALFSFSEPLTQALPSSWAPLLS